MVKLYLSTNVKRLAMYCVEVGNTLSEGLSFTMCPSTLVYVIGNIGDEQSEFLKEYKKKNLV